MGKRKEASTRRAPSADRVSLSEPVPPHASVRDALLTEQERTGVGPTKLLKGALDTPEGLEYRTIANWLCGSAKSARADHLEYVLERWCKLPSAPFVPITPELHRTLEEHRDRTGVGSRALLSRTPPPEGLTFGMIDTWFNGLAASARQHHLEFVLAAYEALPPVEHVAITAKLRDELLAHRKRTGIGPYALLSGRKDKPDDLRGAIVAAWVSGTIRTARSDHLQYVLERWKNLPSATHHKSS